MLKTCQGKFWDNLTTGLNKAFLSIVTLIVSLIETFQPLFVIADKGELFNTSKPDLYTKDNTGQDRKATRLVGN